MGFYISATTGEYYEGDRVNMLDIEVTQRPGPGHTFVDGNWVAPEPPDPILVAKQEREAAVAAITVTTSAGNTFDGDETSQGRMSRAVVSMNNEETILWVLADNTPIQATRAELYEALRLAGQAQTAIWLKPYETEEPL